MSTPKEDCHYYNIFILEINNTVQFYCTVINVQFCNSYEYKYYIAH